ncbi:glycerate kinase, partial [Burkholderia pseudomallei]
VGGEGRVVALVAAAGGESRGASVADPLGRPTRAAFGILADGTAVIEMAEASGLHHVAPDARDPRVTSSRGTGELIPPSL